MLVFQNDLTIPEKRPLTSVYMLLSKQRFKKFRHGKMWIQTLLMRGNIYVNVQEWKI